MNMLTVFTLLGATAVLSACGSSEPGRVQGGAATGAAVGVVGGPVGMVVGGGAGAIAGSVTTPDQIDLGKPVWERK